MRSVRKDLAYIRSDNAKLTLILPIRTPYDHQVMLAHVRHLVRRYRGAQVAVNGRIWSVSPVGRGGFCSQCERRLTSLQVTGLRRGSLLCGACALMPGQKVSSAVRADSPLLPHRRHAKGAPDPPLRGGAPHPRVSRLI